MIYNGNLDTVCPVPGEEATLYELEWEGRSDYRAVSKIKWRVLSNDSDVAGYVRQIRNLYQVCYLLFIKCIKRFFLIKSITLSIF